jgi:hypothetical protein
MFLHFKGRMLKLRSELPEDPEKALEMIMKERIGASVST